MRIIAKIFDELEKILTDILGKSPWPGADPENIFGGPNQGSRPKVKGEARIEGAKRPSIEGEARIDGAKRLRIEGEARTEGEA